MPSMLFMLLSRKLSMQNTWVMPVAGSNDTFPARGVTVLPFLPDTVGLDTFALDRKTRKVSQMLS
jgi:hypothetical protein